MRTMQVAYTSDTRPRSTGCYVCRFHGGQLDNGHIVCARPAGYGQWVAARAAVIGSASLVRTTISATAGLIRLAVSSTTSWRSDQGSLPQRQQLLSTSRSLRNPIPETTTINAGSKLVLSSGPCPTLEASKPIGLKDPHAVVQVLFFNRSASTTSRCPKITRLHQPFVAPNFFVATVRRFLILIPVKGALKVRCKRIASGLTCSNR